MDFTSFSFVINKERHDFYTNEKAVRAPHTHDSHVNRRHTYIDDGFICDITHLTTEIINMDESEARNFLYDLALDAFFQIR